MKPIFLFLVSAIQSHAAPKSTPAKDLVPLMTLHGRTLLDEDFSERSWEKNWKPYKGDFQLVDGSLRMTKLPDARHPPEASHHVEMHDVSIQFRFRLADAKYLALQISDDKAQHHLLNIAISPEHAVLNRVTGWGPTTRARALDRAEHRLRPKDWHTALLEIRGKEVCVQIDDEVVLLGESEGLDVDKPRLSLTAGAETVFFDDVKIRDARPNPDWEKTRVRLLAKKARRD